MIEPIGLNASISNSIGVLRESTHSDSWGVKLFANNFKWILRGILWITVHSRLVNICTSMYPGWVYYLREGIHIIIDFKKKKNTIVKICETIRVSYAKYAMSDTISLLQPQI